VSLRESSVMHRCFALPLRPPPTHTQLAHHTPPSASTHSPLSATMAGITTNAFSVRPYTTVTPPAEKSFSFFDRSHSCFHHRFSLSNERLPFPTPTNRARDIPPLHRTNPSITRRRLSSSSAVACRRVRHTLHTRVVSLFHLFPLAKSVPKIIF
jgi:hypothetical protein